MKSTNAFYPSPRYITRNFQSIYIHENSHLRDIRFSHKCVKYFFGRFILKKKLRKNYNNLQKATWLNSFSNIRGNEVLSYNSVDKNSLPSFCLWLFLLFFILFISFPHSIILSCLIFLNVLCDYVGGLFIIMKYTVEYFHMFPWCDAAIFYLSIITKFLKL